MANGDDNLLLRLHRWASRQDENFTTECFAHLLQYLLKNQPAIAFRILDNLTNRKVNCGASKICCGCGRRWTCGNFGLVDAETAFAYGRLAFELKKIGRPVGQNDIRIAATALTLGNCTVVSSDSDLSSIPGLTVENWAAAEGRP
jgi:hypothetical protein